MEVGSREFTKGSWLAWVNSLHSLIKLSASSNSSHCSCQAKSMRLKTIWVSVPYLQRNLNGSAHRGDGDVLCLVHGDGDVRGLGDGDGDVLGLVHGDGDVRGHVHDEGDVLGLILGD